MRRLYTALAIALVLSASLVACFAAVPAEAAPATSISVNQNGSYAALSVSAGPKDQVRWDFDDGSFGSGSSTGHTWEPGLYNVRAVIIPASGDPYVLSKHVGVYSPGPVTEVQRNEEYRYAVYNGPDPSLTVTDSQGRVVSWLTYDPIHRIVTGVPRDVGTYHATLTGERTLTWTITVVDGPLQAPWVRFSAHADNGTVVVDSLYGSSNDAANRYTWTLRDLDGSTVGITEARTPDIKADPGVYLLSLTVQGVSGSASYAQLIVMDGPEPPPKDDNEINIGLPWIIFGLAAVVAGLLYAATRDYRAALGAILSIGVMITLLVW
jgi:hypothetical protein